MNYPKHCKLDDLIVIARRKNPKYDSGPEYVLMGCKKCPDLWEVQYGPEEDRWGSAKENMIIVDYRYVEKEYGLNECFVRGEQGLD